MKNLSNHLIPSPKEPFDSQQVVNNEGGYVYALPFLEELKRFILLGIEGGTYYCTEHKVAKEFSDRLLKHIETDEGYTQVTLHLKRYFSKAPKKDTALFVFAILLSTGKSFLRASVYTLINELGLYSTYLFQLVGMLKPLRGWSRGLRSAIAKWYTGRSLEDLAYQAIKYRNRAGYTHRDILRLCHAKPRDPKQAFLFKYIVGKCDEEGSGHPLIQIFGLLKTCPLEMAVELIKGNEKVTWEMVPTEKLNSKEVLLALLPGMPFTAMLRNLNRYAYNGITETRHSPATEMILRKLKHPPAYLHPISILNSYFAYKGGRGLKGNKTWTPCQDILDGLVNAFTKATQGLQATGKKILIAVDISSSMSSKAAGYEMSARQIGLVLGYIMLKQEPNAELILFGTGCERPSFGRSSSLQEVLDNTQQGGGTNCAIPFMYAWQYAQKYDAIVMLTDSETWAGDINMQVNVKAYEKHFSTNLKIVEVALVENPTTTLPQNARYLRVVGFDDNVPAIVQEFISGVES